MNFSIQKIMRRLWAPRHKLSCSSAVWNELLTGLRSRGRGYSRESGAFLLGTKHGKSARIESFVLYDDLDPRCLDTGIVRFDGRHFGALWDLCKVRNQIVVADIHVHPHGVGQSDSDKAHPMIAKIGHLALILPRFAKGTIGRKEIGIYSYLGAKKWEAVPLRKRNRLFYVGF